MAAYYNEFEPRTAAWLRELIKAGLIADGTVDERPIEQVEPGDLEGFEQIHLFAGIGGWSYALRLAGVPDDFPVWTGSCPCQPFSNAGKRKGKADHRHVWPQMRFLVQECQPAIVFGEQVASKLGREWLAGVFADMEGLGYAVAGADLCAASVGAPHIRQRLYWMADAGCELRGKVWPESRPNKPQANIHDQRRNENGRLGYSSVPGPQEQWGEYQPSGERCSGLTGFAMQAGVPQWNGPTVAVKCSDGARRISSESNSFPLAHGIPNRMVKLRGFGNAIVPQVAAEFIKASLESIGELHA